MNTGSETFGDLLVSTDPRDIAHYSFDMKYVKIIESLGGQT